MSNVNHPRDIFGSLVKALRSRELESKLASESLSSSQTRRLFTRHQWLHRTIAASMPTLRCVTHYCSTRKPGRHGKAYRR
jgi:hypothetical protein